MLGYSDRTRSGAFSLALLLGTVDLRPFQPDHFNMSWTPEQIRKHMDPIAKSPGVYLMKDADGRIIYVGKAINLASRVANYFQKSGDPRPFVKRLSRVLDRIDTVVTSNEKEALLLESELIKRHRPPFNVILMDDKHFLYLRIDPAEDFPRIDLVRTRKPDRALYFGPYHSAFAIRQTLSLVNRHFGLRTCPNSSFRNRARPCLEFQMRRCLGPCSGKVAPSEYRERVDSALLFLGGRRDEVIGKLKVRMEAAATDENFEEAARLRDQIRAVETSLTRQAVVLPATQNVDAIGFARSGDTVTIVVNRFESGVLGESVPIILEEAAAPEEEFFEALLLQFYARAPVPSIILVPKGIVSAEGALAEILGTRTGFGVQVTCPSRGVNKDALKMAMDNAGNILAETLVRMDRRNRALTGVAEILGLSRPPKRIETYDMSNLFSNDTVGSMVVFTDGKPDRRAYRTFVIRMEEGAGDTGSMREVLLRRLRRVVSNDGAAPDLILLDGGEAQLGTAILVLDELELDIPVAALAKSRVVDSGTGPASHSPERLFVPLRGVADGGTGKGQVELIIPPPQDPGLHLLMRCRDEAHQFAISFHRKRRAKRAGASILDDIPGLGKNRRMALLRHFRTIGAIKGATVDELAIAGIPGAVAQAVFDKIHSDPG